MKPLIPFIAGLILVAPSYGYAQPKIDPEIHKKCIVAKDYSGCVNSQLNGPRQATTSEECWNHEGKRLCIANEGSDIFGLPKIPGTIYQINNNGTIAYFEWDGRRSGRLPKAKVYLVPHKGQKRYIALRARLRYYQQASPGTSATSTAIGSATTSCNGIGSFINCTTTPAPTIDIPGRAPTPGGVRTVSVLLVHDCKDNTEGFYVNGRLKGKWIKTGGTPACDMIDKMPVLNFKL